VENIAAQYLLEMISENEVYGNGRANDRNVNANDDLADYDFEDHMIYDGDDYSVNFYKELPIKLQTVQNLAFDGGVVRETIYRMHLNEESWARTTLDSIRLRLGTALELLIERLNECYQSADLVRFCFMNSKFHTPQSVGLMPLHQVNVFNLMDLIENVLQSDEELYLDEPLEIHVGIIRNPLGAGVSKGFRFFFRFDDDLHHSKSLVKIVINDSLCLARSIVVALAKINKMSNPDNKQLANEYSYIIDPKRNWQGTGLHNCRGRRDLTLGTFQL
jgi:hypothetical protein